MVFIILVAIIYAVYICVDAIMMLLNEYVDDYYSWVILVFLIPLFGAILMLITYAFNDSRKIREQAMWATLVICLVAVWYLIWALIYFCKLYPEE